MQNDIGHGIEEIAIGKAMAEMGHWKADWNLKKYASQEDFEKGIAYAEENIPGNLLVNVGINLLLTLLAGGGGTAFTHAASYLAVGTNATAATAADTTMGTETARVAMDTSYPTYGTSQQIVFRSTFDGSTANVHWQEFGAFNNASSGTMLNHKISDQGTKTAGQVWQLTLTITIS